MDLLFFWLFQLKVQQCVMDSVVLLPYTKEQKIEICINEVLREERRWKKEVQNEGRN